MTEEEPLAPNRKKRIVLAACVLLVLAMIGGAIAWWKLRPHPFGMESRLPWTTSKVIGSPEPGDPFAAERVFPNLTFKKPVDFAFAPGGKRVVVAQQDGQIFTFPNDRAAAKADLLLDLAQITANKKVSNYRGVEALGVTLDPNFNDNQFFYVCYRLVFPPLRAMEYKKRYPQNKTATHVSRFTVNRDDPPAIDPTTESVILAWPGGGNNGGCIKFGPDNNLYISTGDNGDASPPDPFEVGQDVNDLRGKILRIDVDRGSNNLPYSIPANNPFRDAHSARSEIFAYGFRNPARFSFDSKTTELWAADMGWDLWESVHRVVNGGNYGWSVMQGPQLVYAARKPGPSAIIAPELALPHTEAAAIIGGVVYRGKRLPELAGQYIFGDSETRRLWAAPCEDRPLDLGVKLGKPHAIAQTDLKIVAFTEDPDGEFYIVDNEGGGIWRIVKNVNPPTESKFPRKLSETGLFADTAKQQPNSGVIPYNVNAAQWVDGSSSERFVAVPSAENVADNNDGNRVFPANTVLVRTLSLPRVVGDASTRRKIETQLMHFDGRRWRGYSYQWNDDQTDAALVEGGGRDVDFTITDPAAPTARRKQSWHFSSRGQCTACHNKAAGHVLGFTEMNLDRTEQYQTTQHGMVADSQLRSFRHIGLMPEPRPAAAKEGAASSDASAPVVLVNPYDEDPSHSLDDRGRSYLHVNCSGCHRKGGGGAAIFDVRRELLLPDTHMVAAPMLGTYELPDSQIVCPGDPTRSVLYYRMAMSGHGHMPYPASALIDDKGLDLVAKWITSLHGKPGAARLSEETRQSQDRQGDALQKLQNGAAGPAATTAIDKLLKSPDAALRLLTALQDGRISAGLRPLAVARAMRAPASDNVRELFSRFAPEGAAAAPKIGPSPDRETVKQILAMTGDADRGRKVFYEFAGGLCSRCHVIAREGIDVGPDLSQIGAKYKKPQLLESILDPSKTIAPGYETYTIKTKNGEVFSGFRNSESAFEIVLRDDKRKLTLIRSEDIASKVTETKSAMPEGLIMDLELQQAADLLEFLATRGALGHDAKSPE